jgi:alcohol dehydrogenase
MSGPLTPFEYRPATRLLYGSGALARLGEETAATGGRAVLLVSDHGLARAGHVRRAEAILRAAGLSVATFLDVEENPTTAHVRAGTAFARANAVDCIVGLGGGSSMDCAKGINFVLTNGGEMADYWGVGKATRPMLPLLAVPTTAGTGSETQSFALIADEHTHQKMACGDPKAACRAAILDPDLTLSQPRAVTVATGLDAVAHALETAATNRRTAMSTLFAREAWRRVSMALPRVLQSPDDLEARAGMQLGACFAGAAIENSMLGAAHSCANPLTARHGIVHGIAVSVMLPHVLRYNADAAPTVYEEYAALAGQTGGAAGLAELVSAFLAQAAVAPRLREHGVPRDGLPALAADAAQQWTARFNPRPLDVDGFAALYAAAW